LPRDALMHLEDVTEIIAISRSAPKNNISSVITKEISEWENRILIVFKGKRYEASRSILRHIINKHTKKELKAIEQKFTMIANALSAIPKRLLVQNEKQRAVVMVSLIGALDSVSEKNTLGRFPSLKKMILPSKALNAIFAYFLEKDIALLRKGPIAWEDFAEFRQKEKLKVLRQLFPRGFNGYARKHGIKTTPFEGFHYRFRKILTKSVYGMVYRSMVEKNSRIKPDSHRYGEVSDIILERLNHRGLNTQAPSSPLLEVIREGSGKQLSLPSMLRDSDMYDVILFSVQEYLGEQAVVREKYIAEYGMSQGVEENVSSAIEKEDVNKEFDSALVKLKEGNLDEQLKAFEALCGLITK